MFWFELWHIALSIRSNAFVCGGGLFVGRSYVGVITTSKGDALCRYGVTAFAKESDDAVVVSDDAVVFETDGDDDGVFGDDAACSAPAGFFCDGRTNAAAVPSR
jgi:hypothetical protein